MNSVFPIFWLVILVLSIIGRGAGAKKKKSASGSSGAASQTPSAVPVRQTGAAARRKAADDCDYGDVNHKYSHESEARIKQLDSYLQAGLIDKKEYAQMLARYRKAEQDFENY